MLDQPRGRPPAGYSPIPLEGLMSDEDPMAIGWRDFPDVVLMVALNARLFADLMNYNDEHGTTVREVISRLVTEEVHR